MNQFELLDGAINADVWLLLLDVVMLAHFTYSYWRFCYKRGYRLDFWHATMLLSCVIPMLIMYPLAASERQSQSTGAAIYELQPFVNQAWLINIAGYVCMYAGFYLVNLTMKHPGLFLFTRRLNQSLMRTLVSNLKSKKCVLGYSIFGIVSALFVIAIVASQFGLGAAAFRLRDYGLANPNLRPFINFALISYAPAITTILGVRYLQHREKWIGALFCAFLVISFTSGARSSFLFVFLNLLILVAMARRHRISLSFILFVGAMLLVVAMLLIALRRGMELSVNSGTDYVIGQILFGNSFSEIRDFAWVLSKWDGQFLKGNTYIAGLLSFIPRSLSEFREANNFATYTLMTVFGFLPDGHGGFRTGLFGEMYMNMGLTAVFILGLAGGYLLRCSDLLMKWHIEAKEPDLLMKLYGLTLLHKLFVPMYETAGFWNNYVLAFIILLGVLLRRVGLKSTARLRPVNLQDTELVVR